MIVNVTFSFFVLVLLCMSILMLLVGTLCVMHMCVKKHQNVKIRNPSVPHFSYVGIRDQLVPNNVIREKKKSESENRLFVVPITT